MLIVASLGLVGPPLPALDPDVLRLPDKIIFSLLGWLLITMMILATVTCDLALLGRSGGSLVAFVGFGLSHH